MAEGFLIPSLSATLWQAPPPQRPPRLALCVQASQPRMGFLRVARLRRRGWMTLKAACRGTVLPRTQRQPSPGSFLLPLPPGPCDTPPQRMASQMGLLCPCPSCYSLTRRRQLRTDLCSRPAVRLLTLKCMAPERRAWWQAEPSPALLG